VSHCLVVSATFEFAAQLKFYTTLIHRNCHPAHQNAGLNRPAIPETPACEYAAVLLESARIYNFQGIRWGTRRFCSTIELSKCQVF
jgi:hypothetical protein